MSQHHQCPAFWLVLFLLPATLSGCVTTKSMSEVGFPLDNSDIYITAVQNELETEASSTNAWAAGGGLLGVLIVHAIDSSANRRAEDAVTDLRNSLIEFAIAEEFSRRIIDSGLAEQLSRAKPKVLFKVPDDDFEHERDFIELHPRVQLTNDLSALEVSIWIREFELTKRKQARFAGFSQGYTFAHALPDPVEEDDRAAYAEAWLDLGIEEIKDLILLGMETTIKAAHAHLQEFDLALSQSDYSIPNYTGRKRYQVWRETEDLLWLVADTNSSEVIIARRDIVLPLE